MTAEIAQPEIQRERDELGLVEGEGHFAQRRRTPTVNVGGVNAFATTPEPGSLILVMSAGALAFMARRRRRAIT